MYTFLLGLFLNFPKYCKMNANLYSQPVLSYSKLKKFCSEK